MVQITGVEVVSFPGGRKVIIRSHMLDSLSETVQVSNFSIIEDTFRFGVFPGDVQARFSGLNDLYRHKQRLIAGLVFATWPVRFRVRDCTEREGYTMDRVPMV